MNLTAVIFVAIIAVLASVITAYTMRNVNSFYNSKMIKSSRQPPSFVFMFAWTFLYISYAISFQYLYNEDKDNTYMIYLFSLNMILNLLWVIVFFWGGNLILSQIIIVLLLLLTLYQAYYVYTELDYIEYNYFVTIMLLTYAGWLCIATTLNFQTHYIVS